VKSTVLEYQRLVSEDKSEVEAIEQTLRKLRIDLATLKRRETAAKTTQQKTMQEADELRDLLEERKPDSGRVIAYQEAINVMTSMT
jgi:Fic family protein